MRRAFRRSRLPLGSRYHGPTRQRSFIDDLARHVLSIVQGWARITGYGAVSGAFGIIAGLYGGRHGLSPSIG